MLHSLFRSGGLLFGSVALLDLGREDVDVVQLGDRPPVPVEEVEAVGLRA